MTREEAIEIIRAARCTSPLRDALETLIPELRESEDDRITRAINNMLPFIPDEAYVNNGVTKEGVLNWLEKQKVIAAIPDELVECYKNLCERGNRGVASLINAINGINEQKEQIPITESKRLANEVIEYLTRCGYSPVLKDDSKKEHFHIDIPRHEDDFWHSEEYKHCCSVLGEYYMAGDYGSDTYTLYIWRAKKEQKPVMIQWTGENLKEIIDFTGKSPKFDEYFKSWDEFENYVHTHNDILKLFCEDGSHYEVPIGAWIVKTPDGYNIPSRFRFIQKPAEWSEEDEKMLTDISWAIRHCAYDDKKKERVMKWFNDDYRKSPRPQPKQEWSKNDTVFLNEITDFFENKTVRLQHDIEMYAHWLKSLPERFQSLAKANEEQNRLSVQAWAARDKDGYVHVFENKPYIGVHPNTWTGFRLGHTLLFDPIFPDLKYEDGPVKVELKFRIIRP